MIEQGSYRFVKTAAVYKHGPHVGWFVGGLCTIEATPCQVEDVYLAYGVDLRHLLHKRGIQQESTSGYLMMSELTEEGEQGPVFFPERICQENPSHVGDWILRMNSSLPSFM